MLPLGLEPAPIYYSRHFNEEKKLFRFLQNFSVEPLKQTLLESEKLFNSGREDKAIVR